MGSRSTSVKRYWEHRRALWRVSPGEFVELMGGEISVESWLGKGSLFHVGLPLALAKSTDAEDIKEVKPAVSGLEPGQSAWRILVVEDNAENRLLLNSLLLQVGFDTRQAENG